MYLCEHFNLRNLVFRETSGKDDLENSAVLLGDNSCLQTVCTKHKGEQCLFGRTYDARPYNFIEFTPNFNKTGESL